MKSVTSNTAYARLKIGSAYTAELSTTSTSDVDVAVTDTLALAVGWHTVQLQIKNSGGAFVSTVNDFWLFGS